MKFIYSHKKNATYRPESSSMIIITNCEYDEIYFKLDN